MTYMDLRDSQFVVHIRKGQLHHSTKKNQVVTIYEGTELSVNDRTRSR